mgnify:CR=1 FL=1
MFFIRENYITEACVSDYKDRGGTINQKICNIDYTLYCDVLCDSDNSVDEIWDEESDFSGEILEDNQYELIICRTI